MSVLKISLKGTKAYSYDNKTEAVIQDNEALTIELYTQSPWSDLESTTCIVLAADGTRYEYTGTRVITILTGELHSGKYTFEFVQNESRASGYTATLTKSTGTLTDDDLTLTIDRDKRILNAEVHMLGVQGDTDSEIVDFKFPRYADGIDLSTKSISIHYITNTGFASVATAVNVRTDTEYVYFSWVISNAVTQDIGEVDFAVHCVSVDDQGIVTYSWATQPAVLPVQATVTSTEQIYDQNPDAVNQWLDIMSKAAAAQEGYVLAIGPGGILQWIQQTGGSGGSGTFDHSMLINRNLSNQHSMSSITGLQEALNGKQEAGNYALSDEVPKTLASLTSDETHRTVTDAEKEKWNRGNISGDTGLGLEGAVVGQIIEILEVDDKGTPIRWKAIPKELKDYSREVIIGSGSGGGNSTNLNDEEYEVGRFTASGGLYDDQTAFRSKNYMPISGGRRIKIFYERKDGNILQGILRLLEYDSSKKLINGPVNCYTYPTNTSDFNLVKTLKPETKYFKLDSGVSGNLETAKFQNARISVYYYEDWVPKYTPYGSGGEVETITGLKMERVINEDGENVVEVITKSCPAKTFSILGDSYSTYGGWIPAEYKAWYADSGNSSPNNVSGVEDTWWYKLSKYCNLSLLVNSSWSGTCISWSGYNEDPAYNKRNSFTTRMKDDIGEKRVLEPKPDIIFVFGGINDTINKSPLGELKYSGWIDEDFLNVLPSVCYMFDYLRKYNPNARIINIIAETVSEEIRMGMKEASTHYEVDNVMLSGINVENGHPNKTGMDQIYTIVKTIL